MAPSRYQDHVEPLSGANHRLLRDISSDRIDSREVNLDIFCDIVADVAQHKADFVWVLDTPPDVRCLTGPADRRSHRPRVRELGSPGMRPTGLSLPGLRKPAHRCRIPHRASTQICQRSGKPCCRPQLVHPLTRNPQLIRDLSRRHQLGRCERLSAQTMLWLANDLHSNGTLGLNYRHNLASHLGERVEHTPIAGRIDRDVNAVSWDPRYQCVEASSCVSQASMVSIEGSASNVKVTTQSAVTVRLPSCAVPAVPSCSAVATSGPLSSTRPIGLASGGTRC